MYRQGGISLSPLPVGLGLWQSRAYHGLKKASALCPEKCATFRPPSFIKLFYRAKCIVFSKSSPYFDFDFCFLNGLF